MNNRHSNIELLRIIAMMMVVLIHCNYASLGVVDMQGIVKQPLVSYARILIEQVCLVGVNVFILISGWFGINFRLKGIFSLLFSVLFIGWFVAALLLPFSETFPLSNMLKLTYFGSYYWFVPSYLILYICAPILNSFAENASKTQVSTFLVAFFVIEFALGWLWDWENYGYGYSFLSFIGLYMTARYLHKYEREVSLMRLKKNSCFLLYAVLTIIPTTVTFFLIKNNISYNLLSYSSPFVIGAALSLLLLFRQIDLETNAFVNWCAASAFSIYLIQLHPMVWPLWLKSMNILYERCGGGIYLLVSIAICLAFSVICILIDKIRLLLWQQILRHYEHNDKRI